MPKKEFDWYEAPSDEVFQDIKQACKALWNTFDNSYGYVTEKIKRVDSVDNREDNYAYLVGMFDILNQRKLFRLLKRQDAKKLVRKIWEEQDKEFENYNKLNQ